MYRMPMTAFAVVFASAVVMPALAEEATPTAPPKTLGDEGKLPPTATTSPPEMGATPPAEVGPSKKMGDEGKLPATKAMSGATPQMNPPPQPPAGK